MKKQTVKKTNKRTPAPDTKKKEKKKPPAPELYKRKWGNQFDQKYTDEEIEKIGDQMVEYFKSTPDAVYYTDFSSQFMINRQRLYEFEKKNKYFAYCYQIVKGIIISRFTKFGLGGKNAVFPIFALKNVAKDEFKDRQDLVVSEGVKIIKDDI